MASSHGQLLLYDKFGFSIESDILCIYQTAHKLNTIIITALFQTGLIKSAFFQRNQSFQIGRKFSLM